MFNVSIREYFSVLNVSIVCICNTARSNKLDNDTGRIGELELFDIP